MNLINKKITVNLARLLLLSLSSILQKSRCLSFIFSISILNLQIISSSNAVHLNSKSESKIIWWNFSYSSFAVVKSERVVHIDYFCKTNKEPELWDNFIIRKMALLFLLDMKHFFKSKSIKFCTKDSLSLIFELHINLAVNLAKL